jgi:hypothetical protein
MADEATGACGTLAGKPTTSVADLGGERRTLQAVRSLSFYLNCATLYIHMAIRFEWDEEKNRTNRLKHGVSFETATQVFDDPNVVLFSDRIVDGEERWQAFGLADGVVILAVAHTNSEADGDDVIRIISARKATPTERRLYAH